MVNILEHFQSPFTCTHFPQGMFYEFEYSLRFELGGDICPTSQPIKRFIHAYERAFCISSEIFESSKKLWLLTCTYGPETSQKKRLKPFKACGIRPKQFKFLGSVPEEELDEDSTAVSEEVWYWHWDAVELKDKDTMKEILWLVLGAELGVRPTSHSYAYLVDFERGIALHPYDDRGLDAVSMSKAHLVQAYETRKSWLLKHDIKHMNAIFAE